MIKLSKTRTLFNAVRRISTKTSTKDRNGPQPGWKSAALEAEKVVGYPTSFLNLRWLLNDEITNVAIHLQKLIGTKHPLLATAKDFFFKNDNPSWGLVVLLISKVAGVIGTKADIEHDKTSGILHSQRVLAEVTEMIRTSILIHKSLMNIQTDAEFPDDLHYGNKIALLSGDYLLTKSFADLSALKNQQVNIIISSTLRDYADNEFLSPRDSQNQPLPARPNATQTRRKMRISADDFADCGPYKVDNILGRPYDEWFLRGILGGANLLGKACQCAMVLGGHRAEVQREGYLFGKHLALAWQVQLDLESFLSGSSFSLVGAPVMLQLAKKPELYAEIIKGVDSVGDCDYHKIRDMVADDVTIEETERLKRDLMERALRNLDTFHDSDAKYALTNIINAM